MDTGSDRPEMQAITPSTETVASGSEYAVIWEADQPGDALIGEVYDLIELIHDDRKRAFLRVRAERGALRAVALDDHALRRSLECENPAPGDDLTIVYRGGRHRRTGMTNYDVYAAPADESERGRPVFDKEFPLH